VLFNVKVQFVNEEDVATEETAPPEPPVLFEVKVQSKNKEE
jgi:hypothetical protein